MVNKVNIPLSTGFGIHLRWCRISTINSRCWFNSGVYIPIIRNFLQKSRKTPSPIWRRKHAKDGGNSNTFSNIHPHLGKWSRLMSICLRWVETTNQHFFKCATKNRSKWKVGTFIIHLNISMEARILYATCQIFGWDNSHLTVSATLNTLSHAEVDMVEESYSLPEADRPELGKWGFTPYSSCVSLCTIP